MAAQFTLRDSTAFVASSEADYSWTPVEDKFIIYDHKFGNKYATINDGNKVFYNTEGTITEKLVRVNDAYSVTQNNDIITLGR